MVPRYTPIFAGLKEICDKIHDETIDDVGKMLEEYINHNTIKEYINSHEESDDHFAKVFISCYKSIFIENKKHFEKINNKYGELAVLIHYTI